MGGLGLPKTGEDAEGVAEMKKLLAGGLVLGLLGLGSAAGAVPIGMSPDPRGFTVGGATGSVDLLPGSTDTDITFQVSLSAGSLTSITVSVFLKFEDPTGSTNAGSGDVGVTVDQSPFLEVTFDFDGGLSAGETSDEFTIHYTTGVVNGDQLTFEVDNGVLATVTATVFLVPEPGVALLMGTGLAGVALLGWRRRS